jgi:hypothetical protein
MPDSRRHQGDSAAHTKSEGHEVLKQTSGDGPARKPPLCREHRFRSILAAIIVIATSTKPDPRGILPESLRLASVSALFNVWLIRTADAHSGEPPCLQCRQSPSGTGAGVCGPRFEPECSKNRTKAPSVGLITGTLPVYNPDFMLRGMLDSSCSDSVFR